MDFEGATALDLFSGTGSISIELVSRGCEKVVSVEKEPAHYDFICKVMETVKTDRCLPIKGDVFKYLEDVEPNLTLYLPILLISFKISTIYQN